MVAMLAVAGTPPRIGPVNINPGVQSAGTLLTGAGLGVRMPEPPAKVSASKTEKHVAAQAEAVKESAAHMEATASAVEQSTQELTQSADRRTILAADRTLLAAERTYAAWLRTGLVAMAGGIGARALIDQHVPVWLAIAAGSILMLFAIFCYAAAAWRQFQVVRHPEPETKALSPLVLVAFSALMGAVALTALVVVIWMPGFPS